VSSQARRDQVAFAIERGHPKRRACELIGIARSTLGYQRKLPLRDAPVLSAIRACVRLGGFRTQGRRSSGSSSLVRAALLFSRRGTYGSAVSACRVAGCVAHPSEGAQPCCFRANARVT